MPPKAVAGSCVEALFAPLATFEQLRGFARAPNALSLNYDYVVRRVWLGALQGATKT